MMKMEIKLDEARIRKDGKYDVSELWKAIDERFEKACTKEILPNGAVMYSGISNRDYYTDFAAAYMILSETKSFATYCVKWIWYNNDDDENLPFQDIDVLANQRAKNKLFR